MPTTMFYEIIYIVEHIYNTYKELDSLRKNRNIVAHKNRVFEDYVKECYNILLDELKLISFLYKNFRFVFESD